MLIQALRSIGYSLEQAVADIIDNSISAKSRNVLVRLVRTDEAIEQVLIVDDGTGMSERRLHEAMRFGADTEKSLESLSKFGMGLKLASLSQATELTVGTRNAGIASGRRWTVESISDDWRCDMVPRPEITRLLKGSWGPVDVSRNGTVVAWSDLDRIRVGKGGLDATIKRLMDRLRLHLGLHFHRFLEDKRIRIWLDSQQAGAEPNDVRFEVEALNPFSYDRSGDPAYPRAFPLDLGDLGELLMEAHVWPANSPERTYKLDSAANRQGFYFYRNDRLIQAGGWNDIRDTEPHSSLARVVIDLPPKLDSHFSLDVQKSSIKAPPVFTTALRNAVDGRKTKFSEYLKTAQSIYRKQERANPDNFPLVPVDGLPAYLRDNLRETLAPNERRVRQVNFEWADIEGGDFFEIDREGLVIRLNRTYRNRVLGNRRPSAADAPLLKVLLFLLLQEDLDSGRVSRKQREWLDTCNRALAHAMKVLRTDDS
ncbi:ATP-binding protein [Myxococcus sp. XM-1-1-1]|uniref:ATP-binding protein n=1 Tax=Myxococcus sp. XM-1-1-1 TaxID=2874602 RepID=UPI001CC06A4C|nr:ATP-binding protein [Myxococcus sp. XM-1-1-1]MBZ4408972.1 ATP-binding protein [Myxococcus sp. XM-1-1-1]